MENIFVLCEIFGSKTKSLLVRRCRESVVDFARRNQVSQIFVARVQGRLLERLVGRNYARKIVALPAICRLRSSRIEAAYKLLDELALQRHTDRHKDRYRAGARHSRKLPQPGRCAAGHYFPT